ncbi:MAG: trigger factor [Elusimicrobia bacterium]|nr:trigger factor [Elusimicrobiota bacterium]
MQEINYKVDRKSDSLIEIKSSHPWESVKSEIDKSYLKIKSMVALPGFRKGKVPMDTIKSRYSAEAESDFMESFAPKLLKDILEKEDITPVTTPGITDFSIEEGKPFELTLQVEVLPEVQLKKYKKLKLTKTIYEISDEDLEKTLNGLCERNASLKPKEGVAEEGDFAVVEFKAFRDGREVDLGMPLLRLVEIGGFDPLPGFDAELIGMKPGDKKEFDYEFQEDFSREELRGKIALFKVLLKDLKSRKIPDVEEIAASMGLKDAKELRKNMKENLQRQADQRSRSGLETQIIEEILANHDLEVPEGLAKEDAARRMKDAATYVEKQGGDPSVLDEKLFLDKAKDDIKAGLLLKEIAEVEEIEVTDDDVKAEEDQIMEAYGIKEREQVSPYVDKSALLAAKVFDFIIEKAKVKEEKFSEDKKTAENIDG